MPPDQLRLLAPGWRDLVEVLLVAFVLYRLLRFLAGTRALQIVFGLLVLLAGWLAASLLKFTMVTYLLSALFTYGVFAIAVVFQQLSAIASHSQVSVSGGSEQAVTDVRHTTTQLAMK